MFFFSCLSLFVHIYVHSNSRNIYIYIYIKYRSPFATRCFIDVVVDDADAFQIVIAHRKRRRITDSDRSIRTNLKVKSRGELALACDRPIFLLSEDIAGRSDKIALTGATLHNRDEVFR